MALLAMDEKQIRRRLQCKMNMRSHRDRRKRSTQQLEATIEQLRREVERAQRQLALYRTIPSPSDGPIAIVMEYTNLFSYRVCGDAQVRFLRACFSPRFTSNGTSLEGFIAFWQKAAPVYATPSNILTIRPIDNDQIEMQVQLETRITRDILGRVMDFVLEDEDEATVDALVATNATIRHVLTRTFYFDTDDSTGQALVSHSVAFDDRYVQIAQLLASARKKFQGHDSTVAS
ncbi:hypothetical protein DYB32_009111 [Aphanomyces invadans]|nr:hypothetical protein DYB32_009111 [Aphanomyces invadans]